MRDRILLLWTLVPAVLLSLAGNAAGQGDIAPSLSDGVYAPPADSFGGLGTLDGFDPYTDPSAIQDPSLMPQSDPLLQPSDPFAGGGCDPYCQPGGIESYQRFLQRVEVEYTLLGEGSRRRGLGLDEVNVYGTFALSPRAGLAPVLLTPGFAVQSWDGPTAAPADLPGQTYSAYLEASWQPQITPWLAASFAVRPGVYSDFDSFNSNSFRVKGSALAIFTLSCRWQVVAGIVYLDRLNVKLLPAGGVIWMPSPEWRAELLFPQPKVAYKLATIGNRHVWVYVGGEYGGDSWTIQRVTGARDQFDYNDLRAYAGLEWKPCDGLAGWGGRLEVGYVFDRELLYERNPPPSFKPDDTFMVRAAVYF